MTTFNLLSLVNNLETNWKNDKDFMDIIHKHSTNIDKSMTDEYVKFEGALDIYPPKNIILNAFNQFNIEDLKVVLIGQDPYINKNEAQGLCFSVPNGTKCPPSLRNVFKEIEAEYGINRTNTDLTDWAKQGILMLNRSLTVREGQSLSHIRIWKQFTEDILKYIATKHKSIVYILWGKTAQEIETFIDNNENLILKWSHPSPLSRKPFVGNNHFRLTNEYLGKKGKNEINWLPNISNSNHV
jgi:uracil-DNA glycosylase